MKIHSSVAPTPYALFKDAFHGMSRGRFRGWEPLSSITLDAPNKQVNVTGEVNP